MKDSGKGMKVDASPYDLNAMPKGNQGIGSSFQRPLRPGEPYNVGNTPRTLSLSGRATKTR
jgi:hypothetical protein